MERLQNVLEIVKTDESAPKDFVKYEDLCELLTNGIENKPVDQIEVAKRNVETLRLFFTNVFPANEKRNLDLRINALLLFEIVLVGADKLGIKNVDDFLPASTLHRQVIPLIISPINELRDAAICAVKVSAIHYTTTMHVKSEHWEELKTAFVNEYKNTMREYLNTHNSDWWRVWCCIIRILGTELHKGAVLVNALLHIEETAFKSGLKEVRQQAFMCWQELLDNFALDLNELCSPKRIKLLLIPLQANNCRAPSIAMIKFNVWWSLIVYIAPCASKIERFDDIFVRFLDFCFGPLAYRSNPESILRPGRKYSSLTPYMLDAFVQTVGHSSSGCKCVSSMKTKTVVPIVDEAMFVRLSNALLDSAVEATICSSRFEAETEPFVMCAWTSIFERARSVKNESIYKFTCAALVQLAKRQIEYNSERNRAVLISVFDIALKFVEDDSSRFIDVLEIFFKNISKTGFARFELKTFSERVLSSAKPLLIGRKVIATMIAYVESGRGEAVCDVWSTLAKEFTVIASTSEDENQFVIRLIEWPLSMSRFIFVMNEWRALLKMSSKLWLTLIPLICDKVEKVEIFDVMLMGFIYKSLISAMHEIPESDESCIRAFSNFVRSFSCRDRSKNFILGDDFVMLMRIVKKQPELFDKIIDEIVSISLWFLKFERMIDILSMLEFLVEIAEDRSEKFDAAILKVFEQYSKCTNSKIRIILGTVIEKMYNKRSDFGAALSIIIDGTKRQSGGSSDEMLNSQRTTPKKILVHCKHLNLIDNSDAKIMPRMLDKMPVLEGVISESIEIDKMPELEPEVRPKGGDSKMDESCKKLHENENSTPQKPRKIAEKPLTAFGHNLDTGSPIKLRGTVMPPPPPTVSSRTKVILKMSDTKSDTKKNSKDDGSCVFVNTDYKPDWSTMSAAQREKTKRKREDIPALYQDLSQSQSASLDIFDSNEFKETAPTTVDDESQKNVAESSEPINVDTKEISSEPNFSSISTEENSSISELDEPKQSPKKSDPTMSEIKRVGPIRVRLNGNDINVIRSGEIVHQSSTDESTDELSKKSREVSIRPKKRSRKTTPVKLDAGNLGHVSKSRKLELERMRIDWSPGNFGTSGRARTRSMTARKPDRSNTKTEKKKKRQRRSSQSDTENNEQSSKTADNEQADESEVSLTIINIMHQKLNEEMNGSLEELTTADTESVPDNFKLDESSSVASFAEKRNADDSVVASNIISSPRKSEIDGRSTQEFLNGTLEISPIKNTTEDSPVEKEPDVRIPSVSSKRSEQMMELAKQKIAATLEVGNSVENGMFDVGTESKVNETPKSPRKIGMLRFVKPLPSPLAKPETSIIKRKRSADDDDDVSPQVLPAAKKKRVSFHDPPTSSQIEYEPENIQEQSKNNKVVRKTRKRRIFSKQKRLPTVRNLNRKTNANVETLVINDDAVDYELSSNDSQSNSSVASDVSSIVDVRRNSSDSDPDSSQGSVGTSGQLDNSLPLYSPLINCKDDIENIISELSDPMWKKSLKTVLSTNQVETIGDLASLTEAHAQALPILKGKRIVKALRRYEKLKQKTKEPDIEPNRDSEVVEVYVMNDELKQSTSTPENGGKILKFKTRLRKIMIPASTEITDDDALRSIKETVVNIYGEARVHEIFNLNKKSECSDLISRAVTNFGIKEVAHGLMGVLDDEKKESFMMYFDEIRKNTSTSKNDEVNELLDRLADAPIFRDILKFLRSKRSVE